MRCTTLSLLVFLLCISLFAQEPHKIDTLKVHPRPKFMVKMTGYYMADSSFVLHGIYQQYLNGMLYVEGNYTDGVKEGEWKKYYSDGALCTQAFYRGGKPHNHWKYYYSTGQLGSNIYFNRGIKAGAWTGYNFDGTLASVYVFRFDTLVSILENRPNGKPAVFCTIKYDQGTMIRDVTLLYPDSSVYNKFTLVGEKIEGEYIKNHRNGKLWEHLIFKNDEIYDVIAMQSFDGRPLDHGTLKNGTGTVNRYYDIGTTHSQLQYTNGAKNGSALFADKLGKTYASGLYKDGEVSGTWSLPSFDDPGRKYEYYDGTRHFRQFSSIEVFHSEVRQKDDGYATAIIKDRGVGYASTLEENFLGGVHHGFCKLLYGDLVLEGNYRFGSRVGEWKTYNLKGIPQGGFSYDNKPWIDTAAADTNHLIPSFERWIDSDFNYNTNYRESQFPEGFEFQTNIGPLIPNPRSYFRKLRLYGPLTMNIHVDYFGFISDIRTVQSPGHKAEEIAAEILKSYPVLRPTLRNGVPVPTKWLLMDIIDTLPE